MPRQILSSHFFGWPHISIVKKEFSSAAVYCTRNELLEQRSAAGMLSATGIKAGRWSDPHSALSKFQAPETGPESAAGRELYKIVAFHWHQIGINVVKFDLVNIRPLDWR
jgi:hypothetical protein